MRACVLLALLLPVAFASTCPKDVPVCAELSIEKYAGLWYEQARSLAFPWDFDCYCTTANYSVTTASYVDVSNRCVKHAPNGTASVSEGKAYQRDPKQPCKLGVQFPGAPTLGPYWIVETDYVSYSIVVSCLPGDGTLHESDIWVLARQPVMAAELKSQLEAKIASLGFDWSDKKDTTQGPGCKYP